MTYYFTIYPCTRRGVPPQGHSLNKLDKIHKNLWGGPNAYISHFSWLGRQDESVSPCVHHVHHVHVYTHQKPPRMSPTLAVKGKDSGTARILGSGTSGMHLCP